VALYGVLADIHGNREALAAALAALEPRAGRLVCLGDIVGYNADPDECVALVRRRCAASIAGNHELIGLGRLDFRRCSRKAEYALRRTRRTLGREAAAWLDALPQRLLLEEGVVLVHGGVRDVQQYMTTPQHIGENAAWLREDFPGARVCFFGHSHEQRVYEVQGAEVRQLPAEGRLRLERDRLYFINPGSVDASRKRGERLAECAVLDSGAGTIEFLAERYDSASSEVKAAAFGYRIPALTNRLYSFQRRLQRVAERLRF
jgi:predicted phosphodiesterase